MWMRKREMKKISFWETQNFIYLKEDLKNMKKMETKKKLIEEPQKLEKLGTPSIKNWSILPTLKKIFIYLKVEMKLLSLFNNSIWMLLRMEKNRNRIKMMKLKKLN
jgi:hypothetical protein